MLGGEACSVRACTCCVLMFNRSFMPLLGTSLILAFSSGNFLRK
jgi:hypothetical protein